MTFDDKITDKKQEYDINREAAYTTLSTGKIDKYELITGEEMLPLHQRRVTEQAKFTYSPSGKAFKEQIKTIADQGEKQIKALEEHGKQLVKYNNEKEFSIHLKQK